MRAACALLMVLGVMGCGAAPVEPAQLGEICGVDGPFRLVALAPDEVLAAFHRREDGFLFVTYHRREATDGGFENTDPTVWSVGTCGESLRSIATGVTFPLTYARWPGVVLGRRNQEHDIVTLDPAGVLPPHVVFADIEFPPRTHELGLVSLMAEGPGDALATLSLHPYPDDPNTETSERVVLMTSTSHPGRVLPSIAQIELRGDDVLTLTTTGELLRISLADGGVTSEQTGVFRFNTSSDGRYLLYQDLESTDPELGEGLVFLRDLTTGEGQLLSRTNLSLASGFEDYDEGLIQLLLPDRQLRVYFVPGLDFVDLPGDIELRRRIADGRWVMERSIKERPIYLGDLRDPSTRTTLFGGGSVVKFLDDGVVVLDAPDCCSEETADVDGRLWFVPFDGATPRRVAARASHGLQFANERYVVSKIDGDQQLGVTDLLLLDLEEGSERLIDRNVENEFFGFEGSIADGVLRYTVRDGERSGIWLARIPEAE